MAHEIRRNGKGTGRWRAQVFRNGKRTSAGVFDTEAAAVAAETVEAAQVTRSRGQEPADEFAARWPDDYAARNRRKPRSSQTLRSYRYAVKGFIVDFAGVPMETIDSFQIEDWANGRNPQPKGNLNVLRSMFSDAIRSGIHRGPNPFGNLGLVSNTRRPDYIPSEADVDRMAEIADELYPGYPAFGAMIEFAAYSCMRPGEIAALDWDCIDVAASRIDVDWHMVDSKRKPLTKNGHKRQIMLPPGAAAALARLPRRLDGIVFPSKTGKRMVKGHWSDYWGDVRAAVGRSSMVFYDLRHFGATRLLERGNTSSDVAFQLGHTDGGRLVEQVYGHPERSAFERMMANEGTNVRPLRDVNDTREAQSA